MHMFFIVLIAVSSIALLAIIVLGVISMLRGGEFNEKYGNLLMRARVGLQGLVILLLVMAYYSSKS